MKALIIESNIKKIIATMIKVGDFTETACDFLFLKIRKAGTK